MIEVFYYSIAGKKTNQTIDDLIEGFLAADYIDQTDKNILKHTKAVAEEGNYPSKEYYQSFYEPSALTYRSLADIKYYCKKCHDFYHKSNLEQSIISAINDADSLESLQSQVSKLVEYTKPSVEEDKTVYLYGSAPQLEEGIKTGIAELDEATNGIQPGNMAFISAFTGDGKSTFVNSIVFKNALEGKKICIVSLELAPDLLWLMFEARYMYQVKGLSVTTQDFLFHKIPSDVLEQVKEFEKDFVKDIQSNIEIIDESSISKSELLNFKALSSVFRGIEEKLGGLDIVAVDHVGQYERMFPDQGNNIIKTYQSFNKTYVNSEGKKPVGLYAIQANREGNKRARKRNGVYDLQAIADLGEAERSACYVIFLYSSDDMKVMGEVKVTLAKHRLGSVISEPITTSFLPQYMTVGQTVEVAQMSDEDFNSMNLDLGDFDDF